MKYIFLFFSGLFLANGIPHFINGISGKEFTIPWIHKYVLNIPGTLFNVIWGLMNFSLSIILFLLAKPAIKIVNGEFIALSFGFIFASIGLSIFFRKYVK